MPSATAPTTTPQAPERNGKPTLATVPCQRLEWDTAFFGFPIARVTATRLERNVLAAVRQWCETQEIRCLYFLADADDSETVRLAEEHGFRFVDIRVTLERNETSAATGASRAQPRPRVVRLSQPKDLPALQAIAGLSHKDSRFFADSEFSRERCRALYQQWIAKSCQSATSVVLVAEHEAAAVGYVTCERIGDTGQIGLLAVAHEAQGHGLGKQLLAAALQWFDEQGANSVCVVTQGRNLKAQRLYQACGFRTSAVQLWYHRWFHPGTDRAR